MARYPLSRFSYNPVGAVVPGERARQRLWKSCEERRTQRWRFAASVVGKRVARRHRPPACISSGRASSGAPVTGAWALWRKKRGSLSDDDTNGENVSPLHLLGLVLTRPPRASGKASPEFPVQSQPSCAAVVAPSRDDPSPRCHMVSTQQSRGRH